MLAAVAACAVLAVGCTATGVSPHACTEIGSPAGVSVTVERDAVVPGLELTLRICQDACVERRVDLVPGSITVGETCSPDDPDGSCSASSSPDGTMVGFVDLATLTAGDGTDPRRAAGGRDRTQLAEVTATAEATYPNGRDCPAGGPQAAVRVTSSGLR